MLLRAVVGIAGWASRRDERRRGPGEVSPDAVRFETRDRQSRRQRAGKARENEGCDSRASWGGRRTACGCAPRCTWRRSGAGTATPPLPSSSCPSTRRTACHGAPARASSLRLGVTRNAQCDRLDGGKTRAPRADPDEAKSRGFERVRFTGRRRRVLGETTFLFSRFRLSKTLSRSRITPLSPSSARAARASRRRAG